MEKLTNNYSNFLVKYLMNNFDRYHFCVNKKDAYVDRPSVLYEGQTISAPHMHAKAIEYLEEVLKPGNSILDIGSGSGYLCACFAEAVQVTNKNKNLRGKVVGIEVIDKLVDYSHNVLQQNYPYLYQYKNSFVIKKGDGKLGYPNRKNNEIYDGIHIGAACDYIPHYILQQLKRGGILVIPLKLDKEKLMFCIVKKDSKGNIHIQEQGAVRYVPLV